MWEELAEQIIGEDADIALDLVIEHQPRRGGGLVLATSSPPSPFICGCAHDGHVGSGL